MENTEAIWQQRLAKRREGIPWKVIVEAEGVTYGGTFTGHLKKARERGWIPPEATLPPAIRSDGKRVGMAQKTSPTQEAPMKIEVDPLPTDAGTGLPGRPRINDADTAAEVHYGAVNEFDALPAGYAKVIQPMRPYSDAEEWALNKSMELYGFIGTIVYDQYGRILDGHHRQRVARLRGLGAPFTITQVRDDAHAIEIARSLNAVRRQYTREERQTLALQMREHDFSYRAIADALRVGPSTVYRDVFGELRIRSEAEEDSSPVPHGTPDPVNSDSPVPHGTPDQDGTPETWTTEPPVPHGTPEPEKRIRGKDGKIYPDKQPKYSHATKAKSSPADRQLAQVINLLMNHAPQWGERHWQAFLEVVQSLRGSKEPAPATE